MAAACRPACTARNLRTSFARQHAHWIPMPLSMILTGDVNLMNVTDPDVPFKRVVKEFHATDVVLSNFECCLYDPPGEHSVDTSEGFYAQPGPGGEALKRAGVHAVAI